jgi:hypothetical protein
MVESSINVRTNGVGSKATTKGQNRDVSLRKTNQMTQNSNMSVKTPNFHFDTQFNNSINAESAGEDHDMVKI